MSRKTREEKLTEPTSEVVAYCGHIMRTDANLIAVMRQEGGASAPKDAVRPDQG
jgi:hypothetical protein